MEYLKHCRQNRKKSKKLKVQKTARSWIQWDIKACWHSWEQDETWIIERKWGETAHWTGRHFEENQQKI